MKRKSNDRGFTLTEVLVAVAVLSVLVMASLQVVGTLTNTTALGDSKQGQLQLQKDLREILLHRETCLGAIQNLDFTPGRDSEVAVKLANEIVVGSDQAHRRVGAYAVQVNSLALTAKRAVTTVPAGQVFSTVLMLNSGSLKGSPPMQFAPSVIATMFFLVDAGNKISACLVGADSGELPQLTCDALGGTLDRGSCRLNASITGVSCAEGEYLKGFDTAGNKECRPFAITKAPAARTCRTETTPAGTGLGSSPRVFPDPCNTSCRGTFGNESSCAGGCYPGARGWYYCANCVVTKEVCK